MNYNIQETTHIVFDNLSHVMCISNRPRDPDYRNDASEDKVILQKKDEVDDDFQINIP